MADAVPVRQGGYIPQAPAGPGIAQPHPRRTFTNVAEGMMSDINYRDGELRSEFAEVRNNFERLQRDFAWMQQTMAERLREMQYGNNNRPVDANAPPPVPHHNTMPAANAGAPPNAIPVIRIIPPEEERIRPNRPLPARFLAHARDADNAAGREGRDNWFPGEGQVPIVPLQPDRQQTPIRPNQPLPQRYRYPPGGGGVQNTHLPYGTTIPFVPPPVMDGDAPGVGPPARDLNSPRIDFQAQPPQVGQPFYGYPGVTPPADENRRWRRRANRDRPYSVQFPGSAHNTHGAVVWPMVTMMPWMVYGQGGWQFDRWGRPQQQPWDIMDAWAQRSPWPQPNGAGWWSNPWSESISAGVWKEPAEAWARTNKWVSPWDIPQTAWYIGCDIEPGVFPPQPRGTGLVYLRINEQILLKCKDPTTPALRWDMLYPPETAFHRRPRTGELVTPDFHAKAVEMHNNTRVKKVSIHTDIWGLRYYMKLFWGPLVIEKRHALSVLDILKGIYEYWGVQGGSKVCVR